MNQIGVITLWMVAMQIGHAFADQMYGCVDLENVKRLRNCQCDGNERERRRAGSAAAITESLTVRIPPQTSQQNNRFTRPKQRFEPCQCCQWRSATIE